MSVEDKVQEYVSLAESVDHISRHFEGAETVGSKFFKEAQELVVAKAEEEMMKVFFEAQDKGEPAGRVVLELNFDKPIGTDALVTLTDHSNKMQVDIIRDQGTPGECEVTAVETNDVPETSKMTLIAGPYGPTGKWGIYTMFPGEEAPAFPNDRQPDEVKESNAKYWQEHGFLATRDEIKSHLRVDGGDHSFNHKPLDAREGNKLKL